MSTKLLPPQQLRVSEVQESQCDVLRALVEEKIRCLESYGIPTRAIGTRLRVTYFPNLELRILSELVPTKYHDLIWRLAKKNDEAKLLSLGFFVSGDKIPWRVLYASMGDELKPEERHRLAPYWKRAGLCKLNSCTSPQFTVPDFAKGNVVNPGLTSKRNGPRRLYHKICAERLFH